MNKTVTQKREKARRRGKEKYDKISIETCFNIDQALLQNVNAKVKEIQGKAVKMPTAVSIKILTIFCDNHMDTKIQETKSEKKEEDSNGREESMETQYNAQEQELIVRRTEENTAATEDTKSEDSLEELNKLETDNQEIIIETEKLYDKQNRYLKLEITTRQTTTSWLILVFLLLITAAKTDAKTINGNQNLGKIFSLAHMQ